MEKGFSVVLLMGILVFGAVTPTNFASADSEKVNVLIGFNGKPDVSLIKQNGGQLKDNFHPFINVVSAVLPSNAIDGLKNNPKISYIEPDLIATIHNHPSATGEYLNVWGVDHIDADLAHANHNGTGVNVVVIDTGINSGHNDIGGINGGWDFVNGDSDPADDHGHGTHVSGTIAGVEGNNGIIGVSPSVNLYGVKVLDAGGSGSYTNVINGIMWAATNGMDVANLSLGGGASTSLCDAVDAATDAGVLIIASAGNSGNPKGKGTNTGYPATCNNAIAVAATTQNDSRASFSSTGQAVEISAPGSGIYSSLLDQSYGSWSGTSMAAPHVSGVAALVKDANSSLTPQELRSILQNTAIDLGDNGRDTKFGFGLVNTLDAISAADSNPVSSDPAFSLSASQTSFSVNVGDDATPTILINPTNGFDGEVSLSSSRNSDNFSINPVDIKISTESILTLDTSSAGIYQITIDGTSGTLSDSLTIDLTVINPNDSISSEVIVDKIEYTREGGQQGDKHLIVSVFVVNDLNPPQPVAGVDVTISLTCDCSRIGWTGTVVSDSSGIAKFQLSNAKSGTYTTNVTHIDGEPVNFQYSQPSVKTKPSNNP